MKQDGSWEQLEEAVVEVRAQGHRLCESLKSHPEVVGHSPLNTTHQD